MANFMHLKSERLLQDFMRLFAWFEDEEGWPLSDEVEFEASLVWKSDRDAVLAGESFVLTITEECYVKVLMLMFADVETGTTIYEVEHSREVQVEPNQQFTFNLTSGA